MTPLQKLKEYVLIETIDGMLADVDADKLLEKIEELLKEETENNNNNKQETLY